CIRLLPLRIILNSFFFFSSRRRHTRFSRDWSSDVCSSDLQSVEIGTSSYPLGDHPVRPLHEAEGVGHRLTEGRGPGPRDRLTVRVPKRREHVSAVPIPLDRGIVYLGSATRGHEGVRHEFSMLLHFVSIPLSIQAFDFNELVNEFLDLHIEGL